MFLHLLAISLSILDALDDNVGDYIVVNPLANWIVTITISVVGCIPIVVWSIVWIWLIWIVIIVNIYIVVVYYLYYFRWRTLSELDVAQSKLLQLFLQVLVISCDGLLWLSPCGDVSSPIYRYLGIAIALGPNIVILWILWARTRFLVLVCIDNIGRQLLTLDLGRLNNAAILAIFNIWIFIYVLGRSFYVH